LVTTTCMFKVAPTPLFFLLLFVFCFFHLEIGVRTRMSILGRATFSSYVESLKMGYERWGFDPPSYDLFRVAWRKFSKNMTFNEKEDFSCKECGEEPETVLFDGTFLSCRKDLFAFAEAPQPLLPPPSILHSDRVFLTAAKGKLLEEFALSSKEKPIREERVSQLLDFPPSILFLSLCPFQQRTIQIFSFLFFSIYIQRKRRRRF